MSPELPDSGSASVGWIAPTEAGRAQQLLDTQPYLVADGLELRWLPNGPLLAHATSHLATVRIKGAAASQRPALTQAKRTAIAAMRVPLTELRGLLKKKYKAGYQAYYPQFGLVRVGKNWRLPTDHDDLLVALRTKLLPALLTHGFDQDADTGTASWQPLFIRFGTAHEAALRLDAGRSEAVGIASPQDEQTTMALRALFHLAQAQFPTTWATQLRAWGWRKTSF